MKRKRDGVYKRSKRRKYVKQTGDINETRDYPMPLFNRTKNYKIALENYVTSISSKGVHNNKDDGCFKNLEFNAQIFDGIEQNEIGCIPFKKIIPFLTFRPNLYNTNRLCSKENECYVMTRFRRRLERIPIDPDGLCFVCRVLTCKYLFLKNEKRKMKPGGLVSRNNGKIMNPYCFEVDSTNEFSSVECLHSYDFEYCGIYGSFPDIDEERIFQTEHIVFLDPVLFYDIPNDMSRSFLFPVIELKENDKMSDEDAIIDLNKVFEEEQVTSSNHIDLNKVFEEQVMFSSKLTNTGFEMVSNCVQSCAVLGGIPVCGEYPFGANKEYTYVNPYWNPVCKDGYKLMYSYPWMFVKLNYLLMMIIGLNEGRLSDTRHKRGVYVNEFVRWAKFIDCIHKKIRVDEGTGPGNSLNIEVGLNTRVVYKRDVRLLRKYNKFMAYVSEIHDKTYARALRFFEYGVSNKCYALMYAAMEKLGEYTFCSGVICFMYKCFMKGRHKDVSDVFPLFTFLLYKAKPRFPKDAQLHKNSTIFNLIPSGRGLIKSPPVNDKLLRELFISVSKNIKISNNLQTLREVKQRFFEVRDKEEEFLHLKDCDVYLRMLKEGRVEIKDWKKSVLSSVLGKGNSMVHVLKTIKEMYELGLPHFRKFIDTLFYSTIFNLYNSKKSIVYRAYRTERGITERGITDKSLGKAMRVWSSLLQGNAYKVFDKFLFSSTAFKLIVLEYLVHQRNTHIISNDFIKEVVWKCNILRTSFWNSYKLGASASLTIRGNCCRNIISNLSDETESEFGEIDTKFCRGVIDKIQNIILKNFTLNIMFQRTWYDNDAESVKDGLFISVKELPDPGILQEISRLKGFVSMLNALKMIGVEKSELAIIREVMLHYTNRKPNAFYPLFRIGARSKGILLTVLEYKLINTRVRVFDLPPSETKFQRIKETAFRGAFFEDLVITKRCCNRVCNFRACVKQGNKLNRKKKNFYGVIGVEIDIDRCKFNSGKNECYCIQHYKELNYFSNQQQQQTSEDVEGNDEKNNEDHGDETRESSDITSLIRKTSRNYVQVIRYLSVDITAMMMDIFFYPNRDYSTLVYYQGMFFGDDKIPKWATSIERETTKNQIMVNGGGVVDGIDSTCNVLSPSNKPRDCRLVRYKKGKIDTIKLIKKENQEKNDSSWVFMELSRSEKAETPVSYIWRGNGNVDLEELMRNENEFTRLFKDLSHSEKVEALKNYLFTNIIPPKYISCCKKWSKIIYRLWKQKYFYTFNKCESFSSIGKVFLIRNKNFKGYVFVRACNGCGLLKQFEDPITNKCLKCVSNNVKIESSYKNTRRFKDFFFM